MQEACYITRLLAPPPIGIVCKPHPHSSCPGYQGSLARRLSRRMRDDIVPSLDEYTRQRPFLSIAEMFV